MRLSCDLVEIYVDDFGIWNETDLSLHRSHGDDDPSEEAEVEADVEMPAVENGNASVVDGSWAPHTWGGTAAAWAHCRVCRPERYSLPP